MIVDFVRRPKFDEIFSDTDFIEVGALFRAHRIVRVFAVDVIRKHVEVPQLSFEIYAAMWGQMSPAEREVTRAAGRLLDRLYARHAPEPHRNARRIRGALVEGLLLERLRTHGRYEVAEVADNVIVVLENGVHWTSPEEVDVAAWDGGLGECHNCKVRAAKIDVAKLRALEEGLPASHFKIGVVSTDSAMATAGILAARRYRPAGHTVILGLEDVVDLSPLQAAA